MREQCMEYGVEIFHTEIEYREREKEIKRLEIEIRER